MTKIDANDIVRLYGTDELLRQVDEERLRARRHRLSQSGRRRLSGARRGTYRPASGSTVGTWSASSCRAPSRQEVLASRR